MSTRDQVGSMFVCKWMWSIQSNMDGDPTKVDGWQCNFVYEYPNHAHNLNFQVILLPDAMVF